MPASFGDTQPSGSVLAAVELPLSALGWRSAAYHFFLI